MANEAAIDSPCDGADTEEVDDDNDMGDKDADEGDECIKIEDGNEGDVYQCDVLLMMQATKLFPQIPFVKFRL